MNFTFNKKAIVAGVFALGAMQAPAMAALVPIDLNTVTPNDMVTALLAGSSGITINSVAYTGANVASGVFSGGNGIIGFPDGILLTSGNVNNVIGPNNSNGATGNNGLAGNALLDTLTPNATFDASLLEIKFTPNSNNVQFSYVFGSEEYHGFVSSGVNDVFGFFVNGTNFALLPDNTPVSIDTVNCGNTGEGQPAGPSGPNCNLLIDNVGGGLDTQLDAITQILTFIAPVNIGVENTLLIGIADAGDRVLDSAVFIKGGSFSTCGGPNQPTCGGGGEVPEPASSSLALLALGLLGFGLAGRRKPKA